jgi:hypothetical protein
VRKSGELLLVYPILALLAGTGAVSCSPERVNVMNNKSEQPVAPDGPAPLLSNELATALKSAEKGDLKAIRSLIMHYSQGPLRPGRDVSDAEVAEYRGQSFFWQLRLAEAGDPYYLADVVSMWNEADPSVRKSLSFGRLKIVCLKAACSPMPIADR